MMRITKRVGGALIVAAGMAAYANSLATPFVFDDITVLVANPVLRRPLFPVVLTARWLTDLTFRVNYTLHGLQVYGYHALNLVVHLGAGLLAYGLLRRVLALPRVGERLNRAADPLALVTALLWMVHPLQTQAVTYVCQRYESLAGLLVLATAYAFVRGVSAVPRAARWWFDLSIIACFLGLGAKETAIAAPPLVLMLDLVLVAPSPADALRRRWKIHAALWLTLGALLVFELRMLQASVALEQNQVAPVSSWTYLWTQAGVILHYLRLVVWPAPLCLDYAWPFVESWRDTWPAILLMAGLAAATLAGLWHRRPAAAAAAWCFATLSPSSSLLPLPDAAFEHRMYLPLLGVLVLLTAGAHRLLGARRGSPALWAAAAAALAGILLTSERNCDYAGELRMWADVVAKRPDNLRGRNDYAVALSQAGRPEEAAAQYRAVLAAIPRAERERFERGEVAPGRFGTLTHRYHFFRAHANWGAMLLDSGRHRAAVRHLVMALRVAPRHPVAEASLRTALRRCGVDEAALDSRVAGLVLGALPLPKEDP